MSDCMSASPVIIVYYKNHIDEMIFAFLSRHAINFLPISAKTTDMQAALQSQKAVTAHLNIEQLLYFCFCTAAYLFYLSI